ncbi:hypothetical protein GS421_09290 [Rhodococcus hoagii]|nr:hypothetical protein [Prescottella equi]
MRRAGVPVANTPGANAASVAEWVVVATASLSRSMGWAHDRLRAGEWPQEQILDPRLSRPRSAPVGIVGFGDIGRRCAVCSRRSAASCVHRTPPEVRRAGAVSPFRRPARGVGRPRARGAVDAVDPRTDRASELARLPEEAIVVNVARGPVVRTDAFCGRLRSDVWAVRRWTSSITNRRQRTASCGGSTGSCSSPHVAGGSATARRRIYEMTAANVARVCHGAAPRWTL